GTGVFLQTTAGHTMFGTIDRSRFENDQNGVFIGLNSNAVVRESVATGNSNAGFYAGGDLNVEDTLTTHNNIGLYAYFGGQMYVGNTTIEDNTTGVSADGDIRSYGNNALGGNTTDGSFSANIGLS